MNMHMIAMLAAVSLATTGARAENLPDLKGTWSGPFRTAIIGHDRHYPGNETILDPPRVKQIEYTIEIEGQDGRLLWGKTWSDPDSKEAFVATITADGKRLIGADWDGSIDADISNPQFLDFCYTQTALGPSGAIIASCGDIKRSN